MKSAFLGSLAVGAVLVSAASVSANIYPAGGYTYADNDADTFANTLIDISANHSSDIDQLNISISDFSIKASLVNKNTSLARNATANLDVDGIKLIFINTSGSDSTVQTITLNSPEVSFTGKVLKNTDAGSSLPSDTWTLTGGTFNLNLNAAQLASYGITLGDSFKIMLDLSDLQFSTSSGIIGYDLDINGQVTAFYSAPEPMTAAGLGVGVMGLALLRRRK